MSNKPGCKTTDIGDIPEEWEVVRLENVLKFTKNGLTYRQTKQGKYPVTRIETISEGVIDTSKLGYLDNLSDKEIKECKLEVGDILFSHINSIEHIAKAAIYLGKPEFLIHGMNLLLLRPNKEFVDPIFLLFYLKYEETRNRFRSWAKKAVNQASINQSELSAFLIPLPPFVEQQKIASILSSVDEDIQKTDEIIQKAQELKKGLMQQLLTKGIGHTKFKQTEIGEIPEEWEVVRLGDVCTSGTGGTPSRKKPEYFQGEIPWVKSTEIDFGVISHTEESISSKALKESSAKLYPKGALLVALYGQGVTRGKCALLGIDAAINQACGAFQSKGKIQLHFAFFWLQANYRRIRVLSQGSNQANLNLGLVRSIKLPLPPLTEQEKIISILSAIDERIEKERQRKEELEKLKKGLMQDLLTGRVRVKVN